MSGKAVSQRVGMNAFLDAHALGGFLTRAPNGFCIDRTILAIVAGKQPVGFGTAELYVLSDSWASTRSEAPREVWERHEVRPVLRGPACVDGQYGDLQATKPLQLPCYFGAGSRRRIVCRSQ